jgi:quercetin dioxygenase-like cupin family protein
VITRKNLLLVACGVLIGALAVAVGQQKQAATTLRTPQFENPNVKVWKTLIMPNQPLSLHRHENGRVIVALQGGTLTIKKEKGDSKKVVWETGKAYWLDSDPPGELHGDVNETTKPIEVMVVELEKEK